MANQAVVGILRTLLTADTAQYEAAMKKSAQTAEQAAKVIGSIGEKVARTNPQLERMAKAFQGDKLLYQANNLVGAITKVGGAAKLTGVEKERVNRTITQAIEKYRALGQQAPPAMVALEQATRRTEVQTSALGQAANRVFQDIRQLARGFQGADTIGEASRVAAAVEKIGGASRLTEAEQARVNRTVTEAIAKYTALGQQAPKALIELEQTTRRIDQATKSLGQGANKVFQDIDRLAKGFQGRDAIGEASRLTAAIERIGGASKLTNAEMARINATLKEAIEKYRVLGQTAPKAMLDLERATRRIETPATFITGKMIAMGSAIGSFVGTIAANAVMRLGQLMLDAANNGAKLGQISTSFDRLTKSIGESASTMLMTSRTATKGLINDLDLMLAANKAILLGLPVTSREMATLAQTAITLGRAMGLDATTALDNLITALGRTSPLILDNLGLTVKLGDANEAYARSLNKTANHLTETEQKMAFYRAAMDAAAKKTAELGEAQLTVSDQFSRISVGLENYIMGTSRSANESGVLARALGLVADELERSAAAYRELEEVRRRLASGQAQTPTEARVQIQGERSLDIARRGTQFATPNLALPPAFVPPQGATLDEIRKLDEATQQLQQRLRDMAELGDTVFGRDLIQRANDFAAVIGGIGNISRISTEQQRQIHDVVTQAIAAYERLGQTAPARLLAIRDATAAAAAESSSWIEANKAALTRLESAIRSAQAAGVPMEAVLQEFGNALEDAVQKARIFGQEVPTAVMDAAAAVGRLDAAIRRMPPLDFDEFLRPMPDEFEGWQRVFDARDERAQQSADRQREASIAAAEFDLRLAERRGASEQDLFVLQERVERAQVEASIQAEQERFAIATRGLDRESALYKERERTHQDNVNELNQQWATGVHQRSALFETEAEKFGATLRRQVADVFTGGFGRLFFGQIGHDVTGELRAAADEAHQDFLRIQRSGRTTAAELALAMKRWREAEDRANFTFGERWKQWMGGLKQTFVSILDEMLQFYLKQFIGGLIKGLSTAKFVQSLGNFLTGSLPGIGGGGGGIVGGIAQTAGSAIPGGVLTGAGGGVGAGALAAGGFTTVNAAGVASTPGFAGAMAPGAAPGAGGLVFLSNPAFWTNPWTIGIVGTAALLTWGIKKKGWFRGGEEGVQVNPRRDKFQLQFARAGESVQEAGHRLAAQLTTWTGQPGGGTLFTALQKADSVKEFERAQAAIVAEFAKHGFRGIKSFHTGGLVGISTNKTGEGLTVDERVIKVLTGESVLTRDTTKAIGGKPAIDALNDRRLLPTWRSTLALARPIVGRIGAADDRPDPLATRSGMAPVTAKAGGLFRFHTGGLIHAGGGQRSDVELNADERVIKVLTGESVLTRETTKAIGGKPAIDALNDRRLLPQFRSALALVRPIAGRLAPSDDRPDRPVTRSGLAPMVANAAGLFRFHWGGVIGSAPGVTSSFGMMHSTLAGQVPSPAGATGTTVINNKYTTINTNIEGVLDRDSVRQVMRDHVWPEFNREMAFNQHGGASSVGRVRTR